jgi:hypothetical protein
MIPIPSSSSFQRRSFNDNCAQRIVDVNDPYGRVDVRLLVTGQMVVNTIIIIIFTGMVFTNEQARTDVRNPLVVEDIINFVCSSLYLVFQWGAYAIINDFVTTNIGDLDILHQVGQEMEWFYRRYSLFISITLLLDTSRSICYFSEYYGSAYTLSFIQTMIFMTASMDATEVLGRLSGNSRIYQASYTYYGFVACSVLAMVNLFLFTLILTSGFD